MGPLVRLTVGSDMAKDAKDVPSEVLQLGTNMYVHSIHSVQMHCRDRDCTQS